MKKLIVGSLGGAVFGFLLTTISVLVCSELKLVYKELLVSCLAVCFVVFGLVSLVLKVESFSFLKKKVVTALVASLGLVSLVSAVSLSIPVSYFNFVLEESASSLESELDEARETLELENNKLMTLEEDEALENQMQSIDRTSEYVALLEGTIEATRRSKLTLGEVCVKVTPIAYVLFCLVGLVFIKVFSKDSRAESQGL